MYNLFLLRNCNGGGEYVPNVRIQDNEVRAASIKADPPPLGRDALDVNTGILHIHARKVLASSDIPLCTCIVNRYGGKPNCFP